MVSHKIEPRPYQTESIKLLYEWFRNNPTGNVAFDLPGGAGKSVIIALLVKDIIQNFPDQRILMLVHSKELVEQNYNRVRAVYPNCPIGVVSASMNRKEYGESVTFAGIQSVRNSADILGHIDLLLIDEVHAVSTKEKGTYRKLISDLLKINPSMRIVGYSASPFRLGHGYITEGETAIFNDIIQPVTVQQLMDDGFLCPLRSKHPKTIIDTAGAKHRGGEFISKDLARVTDTDEYNEAIIEETLIRAKQRKKILCFAVSIDHAKHLVDILLDHGESADFVSSKDSKKERERKLSEFSTGKIRFLVNIGILTTGYDEAMIDCLVLARDTESPGLYMQMVFRGTRPVYSSGTQPETREQRLLEIANGPKPDCLVLDFCGLVSKHGPIIDVQPPRKAGNGVAPGKLCEVCDEICNAAARTCPSCGHVFEISPTIKDRTLRDDDIMGIDKTKTMPVFGWNWEIRKSRKTQKEMIVCTYYGELSTKPIEEFFCVWHGGFAQRKAMIRLGEILPAVGVSWGTDTAFFLYRMNERTPPEKIKYVMEGRYPRVVGMEWKQEEVPF